MRKVFFLLLVLTAIPAHAIVNGKPVDDERFTAEYPWAVVVVHNDNGGICGGVLIAPTWVLTAGHCVAKDKHVLVGNARQSKARRVEVLRGIRHRQLDPSTLQYDVGLFELAEAVDLPTAPLPDPIEARTLLTPDNGATAIGWGKTRFPGAPEDRLREGAIELGSLSLAGTQIIYDYDGGGPCGRDSGSAMIMYTLDGRPLVVGVASATDGELCASNGGIAIYSNIAAVLDFIGQFTGD